MNKISFCVTNYNRFDFLFRCINDFLDDKRVAEIIISDDCSLLDVFKKIQAKVEEINNPKIKLHRNINNQGVYVNKKISVSLASSDYVIVADSDNVYGKSYLDRIYKNIWQPDIIFNPTKALPIFDFSHFSGLMLSKENIAEYMSYRQSETFLNLMNYFVHRESYLDVWQDTHDPIGSDSIYQNYNWLKSGRKIYCMPDLFYNHEIHSGSHYVQNALQSDPLVFDIVDKLKKLK